MSGYETEGARVGGREGGPVLTPAPLTGARDFGLNLSVSGHVCLYLSRESGAGRFGRRPPRHPPPQHLPGQAPGVGSGGELRKEFLCPRRPRVRPGCSTRRGPKDSNHHPYFSHLVQCPSGRAEDGERGLAHPKGLRGGDEPCRTRPGLPGPTRPGQAAGRGSPRPPRACGLPAGELSATLRCHTVLRRPWPGRSLPGLIRGRTTSLPALSSDSDESLFIVATYT